MARPCVDSDLIAGLETSFSSSAPLQAGHAGAGVVGSTSASNSFQQPLQAYSKIGMTHQFYPGTGIREPGSAMIAPAIPVPGSRFPASGSRSNISRLGEALMGRALRVGLLAAGV